MAADLAGGEKSFIDGWTFWVWLATGTVVLAAAIFIFYIYIIIAMIVATTDDKSGKYDPSTATVNASYNLPIFFTMNSVYLLLSLGKFFSVQWTMELFGVHNDDVLYALSEDVRMYAWDPDYRLQLTIEGWAELGKTVCIIVNYIIYWQIPEVFILLMKS